MTEILDSEKCPCGTGLEYSQCCKGAAFKWVRNDENEVFKVIPISEEAHENIKEMATHYNYVFNREPEDTDPLFLGKYLYSDIDIEKQAVDVLERADIAPQLIYAYKKTGGLMVLEDKLDLYTKKDLEDWDNAIDEYFELLENPPETSEYLKLWDEFKEELDNCIIAMGYAIENGSDPNLECTPSSSSYFSVDNYVFLCASKSIKTLRAIRALLKDDIGSDCIPLARHIYENFLHILIAKNKPDILEHMIDAVVGMKLGTHEYERNNSGKLNPRVIVRKSDGKKFIGHISTFKMAESSSCPIDTKLFDYMYEFLSEYTHPSFTSLQLVITENGMIDTLSNELEDEACFLSIFFSALVLNEVAGLNSVNTLIKRDLITVTQRIKNKALFLIEQYLDPEEKREHFQILKNRLNAL